jgi:hypothetical protein
MSLLLDVVRRAQADRRIRSATPVPSFSATDLMAAHCESCDGNCSCTMRTARWRTSNENLLWARRPLVAVSEPYRTRRSPGTPRCRPPL